MPARVRKTRSSLLSPHSLFSGLGQVYNGHWKKGVVLLVAFIIIWLIFWLLSLIVWIFGMYDAYTMAQKINNGENVPDLFSK